MTGLASVVGPFIVAFNDGVGPQAPGQDITTLVADVRQYAIASAAGHIIGISGYGTTGSRDGENRITLQAAVNDVFASTTPGQVVFEIGSGGLVGTPPSNYVALTTPYPFNAGDRLSMQYGNSNAANDLVIQGFLTIMVAP